MKFVNKKYWFLVVCILAASSVIALGPAIVEISPSTPEQLQNAEEWRKYSVRYDTPKCSGDILVEIGDVRLMIPRDSNFQLYSGEPLKKDIRHPLYNCDINEISAVTAVTWRDLSLSDPNFGDDKTMYQRKSEIIKEATKKEKVAQMVSGLRKIKLANSEIYIYPLDKHPTADGEPIALYCEGLESQADQYRAKSCYTRYLHPLGVSLGYKFFRYNHPTNSYIGIDQNYRHKLENMAQNIQQYERQER